MKGLLTVLSLICCGAAFGASNGSNGDYLLAELEYKSRHALIYPEVHIFNSLVRRVRIAVEAKKVKQPVKIFEFTVGWLSEDSAREINGYFFETTGTMHIVAISQQCSIAGCIDVGEKIITEVPLKPTGVGQLDINLKGNLFDAVPDDGAMRIVLRVALTTTKTKTEKQKRAEEVVRKAKERKAAELANRRAVEQSLRKKWDEDMANMKLKIDANRYGINEWVAAKLSIVYTGYRDCKAKNKEFYATMCPLDKKYTELVMSQNALYPTKWPG